VEELQSKAYDFASFQHILGRLSCRSLHRKQQRQGECKSPPF